jgi:hypothetical protein
MTVVTRILCAAVALTVLIFYHAVTQVHARDDGRYAQSPLKGWFDSLKSQKGFCCSVADGEDTEYDMRADGYWAPIDGTWQRVPEEAVIKEPNKAGRAMKWLFMENGEKKFRCFLPAGGV